MVYRKKVQDEFKFRIPFTIGNLDILKNKSLKFSKLFQGIKNKKLKEFLISADVELSTQEYLSIVTRTVGISFIFFFLFGILLSMIVKVSFFIGIFIALLFSCFIFAVQFNYPRIYSFRKSKNLEKNLIPALQDMIVQLESGIPMFQILSNISNSEYGMVSKEFRKVVRQLNTGMPQVLALEGLIKKTGSDYFKRVLWQISNGLRSGSDMIVVIKDGIDSLNKEQAIQIQNYGGKLNPLVMFYMLITVIVPSLGITFLIIISSMLGLSATLIKLVFISVFVFIVIIQILFLGLVKTRRPSLL